MTTTDIFEQLRAELEAMDAGSNATGAGVQCPECASAGNLTSGPGRIKFDCGACDFITSLDARKKAGTRFQELMVRNFGKHDAGTYAKQLEFQAHPEYWWRDGKTGKVPVFEAKDLPELARPITQNDVEHWNYLIKRCIADPAAAGFHVAPDDTGDSGMPTESDAARQGRVDMNRRVILPWNDADGRTIGWSARHIDAGAEPRYVSSHPPRAVWGLDRAKGKPGLLVVCEGEFDALILGDGHGVAVGCNSPHRDHAAQIDELGRQPVVVPDNDAHSNRLAHAAHRYGWALAFLPASYKDIGEAVKDIGAGAVLEIVRDSVASDLQKVLK